MGTFTAARFATFLALAAVAVALVLGPPATGAAAAPIAAIATGTTTAVVRTGTTPTDVVVVDRAGVLDLATLLPAVRGIEFYQPTKVAVYTYNGTASDNLNEEVLRYARAEHPDWISPDGQKWADGLFIFALDPVGRHVGTYMGEDRKVSPGARTDIQDASKDLLRDAQWTDGTIAGIRRANALLNRSPLWPTAWDRQLAPFRRDLAGIEDLLRKSHGAGDSATAAALRSFRDRSQSDMEGWTADLAGGALGPEDALDRLRDARTELTELLNRHA